MKELQGFIKKLKDIIRCQYNGLHITAFTSLNNLLGIDEENNIVSRLITKFIHKNSLNDNVCAKIPLSP